MKTLIHRLADEAKAANTGPGEVYLVRLLRERDGDDLEAYERLGRAVPVDVLKLPGIESWGAFGEEVYETEWVAILHGDDCVLIPLSRFTPHWSMYAGS